MKDESIAVEPDWVDYGIAVQGFEALELERQYASLAREYAASPATETTVKLALLLADDRTRFYDAERALRLIDEAIAAGDAADSSTTRFLRFTRSLIEQLAETRGALEVERERREILQHQLDALKALEERLNANELVP